MNTKEFVIKYGLNNKFIQIATKINLLTLFNYFRFLNYIQDHTKTIKQARIIYVYDDTIELRWLTSEYINSNSDLSLLILYFEKNFIYIVDKFNLIERDLKLERDSYKIEFNNPNYSEIIDRLSDVIT